MRPGGYWEALVDTGSTGSKWGGGGGGGGGGVTGRGLGGLWGVIGRILGGNWDGGGRDSVGTGRDWEGLGRTGKDWEGAAVLLRGYWWQLGETGSGSVGVGMIGREWEALGLGGVVGGVLGWTGRWLGGTGRDSRGYWEALGGAEGS